MTTNKTTTTTEGRDLVLTRIIDAPREKVFRAWTDPALLKRIRERSEAARKAFFERNGVPSPLSSISVRFVVVFPEGPEVATGSAPMVSPPTAS